jgi:hypothetical protein
LLVEELNEIPVRFESIDVGILHLGGTRLPAGRRLPFGLTVTMDGTQGAADDVEYLRHQMPSPGVMYTVEVVAGAMTENQALGLSVTDTWPFGPSQ